MTRSALAHVREMEKWWCCNCIAGVITEKTCINVLVDVYPMYIVVLPSRKFRQAVIQCNLALNDALDLEILW